MKQRSARHISNMAITSISRSSDSQAGRQTNIPKVSLQGSSRHVLRPPGRLRRVLGIQVQTERGYQTSLHWSICRTICQRKKWSSPRFPSRPRYVTGHHRCERRRNARLGPTPRSDVSGHSPRHHGYPPTRSRSMVGRRTLRERVYQRERRLETFQISLLSFLARNVRERMEPYEKELHSLAKGHLSRGSTRA